MDHQPELSEIDWAEVSLPKFAPFIYKQVAGATIPILGPISLPESHYPKDNVVKGITVLIIFARNPQ